MKNKRKKSVFSEKRFDGMTWIWTSYSATDYTCLEQRPRNWRPFVSKIFLVILVPHQLGILHGFPRTSFDLNSPDQTAAHLCATKRISLLDWMTFLWCWPWNLGLCVSDSLLLHGPNHRIWPGWIRTKLQLSAKPDSLAMNRFNLSVLKGND